MAVACKTGEKTNAAALATSLCLHAKSPTLYTTLSHKRTIVSYHLQCDEPATFGTVLVITHSIGRNRRGTACEAMMGEVRMNVQHARYSVTQGNECHAHPQGVFGRCH